MRKRVFQPNFEKCDGLLPVIAVDVASRRVLMLAYVNREAFNQTLRTGKAVYFSRSRKKLWQKGEESGNEQIIYDVLLDCDADALIYVVKQIGQGACHTEAKSCFYRSCIDARQLLDAPKSTDKETVHVEYMTLCEELPRSLLD